MKYNKKWLTLVVLLCYSQLKMLEFLIYLIIVLKNKIKHIWTKKRKWCYNKIYETGVHSTQVPPPVFFQIIYILYFN